MAHAQPAPVPAAYYDLYTELARQVDAFDQTLDAEWDGRPAPVLFSAEFFPANSNRNARLIESLHVGFQLALDRFEELGVKAVTFNISYPLLHSSFHRSLAERAEFIEVYRRLASEVRARRLKLIVKSHAMLADDPAVAAFYAGLRSYDEYRRGRMEVVYTIASELRPDFISVQSEPDTEALVTGQPVDSPEASLDLVRSLVTAARLAGSGAAIGAGIGTWQREHDTYVTNLLTRAGIDYLDLHVYPIGAGFLDRILGISDRARLAGIPVAVSDAWLLKVREQELPFAPLMLSEITARDAFSFWAPLDERFLTVMTKLAHSRRFLFLSPFWSNYFFAYLDYSRVGYLGERQIMELTHLASILGVRNGMWTTTGLAYRRLARW
jgi:hypothetical protein